jgi:hypothetical protein
MDAPDGKLDTLLIQCVVPSQHVLQQRGSLMSQPISLPVERVTDSLWNDSMTPEDFQKFYPLLIDWLRTTLATYAGRTQTVASRAFPRLPLYFTAETIVSVKVVLVY